MGLGCVKLRVEAVIEGRGGGNFGLGPAELCLKTVVKSTVLTLAVRFKARNGCPVIRRKLQHGSLMKFVSVGFHCSDSLLLLGARLG